MITDWKTRDDLRRLIERRFSISDQSTDDLRDELEFSSPLEKLRVLDRWVDQRRGRLVDDLCTWLEETK